MEVKNVTENLDNYLMMHSAEDMFALAQPLNSIIDITHFSYHRLYKNNTRIHLSTHPDFIDFFHKNKLYKFSSTSLTFDNYKSGYYILDNLLTKDLNLIISLTLEIFDYYHPFLVIKKNDHYCEFFYFSTNFDNYVANNFYLNNIDLFEKFIFYFKNKASKLINKISNERFIYPELEKPIETNPFYFDIETNKKAFNKTILLKRYKIENISVYITHRELQCLKYLKRGYTSKAIANLLTISHRTVEAHINSLKIKLNKKTKIELIKGNELNFHFNEIE